MWCLSSPGSPRLLEGSCASQTKGTENLVQFYLFWMCVSGSFCHGWDLVQDGLGFHFIFVEMECHKTWPAIVAYKQVKLLFKIKCWISRHLEKMWWYTFVISLKSALSQVWPCLNCILKGLTNWLFSLEGCHSSSVQFLQPISILYLGLMFKFFVSDISQEDFLLSWTAYFKTQCAPKHC